jgi:hypothetical protein
MWGHRHPVAARILSVVVLVAYFTFVQARAAHAAGFLPDGVDYKDSGGNPFSKYATINIDPGDVWNPGKVIVNFVVQFMWSIEYFFTGVIIWLFSFLLSFKWVAWLAVPFNTLAVWLQGQLGTINWIPFALMISALVGGIAIYVGRVAGGLWEMGIAAVLAVLALGALANPVATLTATNGMLDHAQTFGGQLATSIVIDKSQQGQSAATMSNAITTNLMDIFVRIPYQVISYGSVLPDSCQGTFNTFIQSAQPQNQVPSCVPDAAKAIHDNPSALNILYASVNGAGVTVLFIFGMVIAGLLIVSVFFFLVAAIKSMLLVYLCILPVNRAPLWRAVSDTFMGLISLVVMTVCLSLYLKLTTWIMGQTGFLPHQLRMVLLILFMIIIIVLVWRARRATLRAGRGVAGHLSNLGLGMKPQPKDANTLLKMSAVASMAKMGYDLFKRSPSAPAEAAAKTTEKATEAVAAPAKARPAAIASGTARKALGAAPVVAAAAKGAASGGAPGAAAAAGAVVVKGAATKAAGTAAARAAGGRRPPEDVGELRVVTVRESAPSSRIEVDSSGAATARRKQTPVHDVSSLPPRAQTGTSQRAIERRRQLEAYRPKELVA